MVIAPHFIFPGNVSANPSVTVGKRRIIANDVLFL